VNGTTRDEPEAAKLSLGFIPDRPFIYEKLTGRRVLRFHGGLYGLGDPRIAERVREMLELFELAVGERAGRELSARHEAAAW
jgi:ABC-2 type transport system ATP-binding protein